MPKSLTFAASPGSRTEAHVAAFDDTGKTSEAQERRQARAVRIRAGILLLLDVAGPSAAGTDGVAR